MQDEESVVETRGREDGGKFLDPFTSQISRRDRKLSERGRDKIKFFLSCNIEDQDPVAVGPCVRVVHSFCAGFLSRPFCRAFASSAT